jgi:hypothetical protein
MIRAYRCDLAVDMSLAVACRFSCERPARGRALILPTFMATNTLPTPASWHCIPKVAVWGLVRAIIAAGWNHPPKDVDLCRANAVLYERVTFAGVAGADEAFCDGEPLARKLRLALSVRRRVGLVTWVGSAKPSTDLIRQNFLAETAGAGANHAPVIGFVQSVKAKLLSGPAPRNLANQR